MFHGPFGDENVGGGERRRARLVGGLSREPDDACGQDCGSPRRPRNLHQLVHPTGLLLFFRQPARRVVRSVRVDVGVPATTAARRCCGALPAIVCLLLNVDAPARPTLDTESNNT